MPRRIALLAAVLLSACATPPDTYSIDPAFRDDQAAVVRDAVEAWCDAVAYCPTEIAWTGEDRGRIYLDHNFAALRRPHASAAVNDGDKIRLDPAHGWDHLPSLWLAVAHEV